MMVSGEDLRRGLFARMLGKTVARQSRYHKLSTRQGGKQIGATHRAERCLRRRRRRLLGRDRRPSRRRCLLGGGAEVKPVDETDEPSGAAAARVLWAVNHLAAACGQACNGRRAHVHHRLHARARTLLLLPDRAARRLRPVALDRLVALREERPPPLRAAS
eukprot:633845-Pleurochrysis_carterae.AAC.1